MPPARSPRRSVAALAVTAAAAAAGCDRPAPLASCAGSLGGVWVGERGGERWHLLDGGERLSAYPVYRDLPAAPPGTRPAPASLALTRHGVEVTGQVVRRWERGGRLCVVRAPAGIRGCSGDRMVLTMADTGPPTDWDACTRPAGPATTLLLRRTWP